MTGLFFVDSNVLVYRCDATEGRKQRQAQSWMAALWEAERGRLS